MGAESLTQEAGACRPRSALSWASRFCGGDGWVLWLGAVLANMLRGA